MDGGELIGEGSKTCIFKPNLPCLDKDIDISEKNISKVFLTKKNNKYFKEEVDFNKKIDKLQNSNIWSVTLFNQCKLDNYKEIKKIEKDMEKCLENQNISIEEFNKNKYMLYGLYGGVDMNKAIINFNFKTKDIYDFLKKTHSLFYGLTIMNKNNILHYDIKSANIVYNDNKFKYIDFGISTTFKDKKKIKSRALKEYFSNRIYIFYPFEIFYIFLKEKDIDLDIQKKIYKKRKNYNNLSNIHKIFFDRNFEKELLNNIYEIKNKKITLKEIIEKLDLYSLGITITLILLQKISNITKSDDDFKLILKHPTIIPVVKLLKNITEISSLNRISVKEALNELENILDYKPKY
tara:strand:- start:5286 stop:6335 length:1050 start_codon:yes stop_codon:yes gene_type:complete